MVTIEKLTDKREQKVLFDKMDTLAKEREDVLENLKGKIKDVKQKTFPKCWHGKYCRRLFCKFNHTHVFTKMRVKVKNICVMNVGTYWKVNMN